MPSVGEKIAASAADDQVASSDFPDQPQLRGRRQSARQNVPDFARPARIKAGHREKLGQDPDFLGLIEAPVQLGGPGGDGYPNPGKFPLEKSDLGQNDTRVSRVEHGVGVDNEYVRGWPRMRNPILIDIFIQEKKEPMEKIGF